MKYLIIIAALLSFGCAPNADIKPTPDRFVVQNYQILAGHSMWVIKDQSTGNSFLIISQAGIVKIGGSK